MARQIRSECPKDNERELKRLFNIALNLKSIEERIVEENVAHTVTPSSLESANYCAKPMMAMGRPRMMMAKRMAMPRAAPMAPMMMMNNCVAPNKSLFSVDQGMADRINVKAQLFKEEGKSKEFCETQYYNKIGRAHV